MTDYSILHRPGDTIAVTGRGSRDFVGSLLKRSAGLIHVRYAPTDGWTGRRRYWASGYAFALLEMWEQQGREGGHATLVHFDRDGPACRWWLHIADLSLRTTSATTADILKFNRRDDFGRALKIDAAGVRIVETAI